MRDAPAPRTKQVDTSKNIAIADVNKHNDEQVSDVELLRHCWLAFSNLASAIGEQSCEAPTDSTDARARLKRIPNQTGKAKEPLGEC